MATTKSIETEIPSLKLCRMVLPIKGISPLITNRFSDEDKQEILDRQLGKAKVSKRVRNPEAEYKASMYIIDEKKGIYGVPAVAFKDAAAMGGARQIDDKKNLPMTVTKGVFHVYGTHGELVELSYGEVSMRTDNVRLPNGSTDIRFRAQFDDWSASVPVTFNAGRISLEQVVVLFNAGGFASGIGDWRPAKKGGSFGQFIVDQSKEITVQDL